MEQIVAHPTVRVAFRRRRASALFEALRCALLGIALLFCCGRLCAEEQPATPELLFVKNLDAEARKLVGGVSVRVDFFRPNTAHAAGLDFFSPGKEHANRLPWTDILLVDPRPGHANGENACVQVRAVVSGIKTLIEKRPECAKTFPIRLYRTFANEADDGEEMFERAYAAMYGKAEHDRASLVAEPPGETLALRYLGLAGDDAIFVSEILDIGKNEKLNPARNPLPPSFAAFDGDALLTQCHETPGDEEADGWGFAAEMRAQGFVSAGLAHPLPRKFGETHYQFSRSLCDIGILDGQSEAPEGLSADSRRRLRTLPDALRVGDLKADLKHIGASEILGRPVTNAAFIISTGVQKLVATARARADNGDISWRFPGIARAVDGSMDQCLVRAPAQVFYFSGHGWEARIGTRLCPILNCYAKDNFSVRQDLDFMVFMKPGLANGRWPGAAPRDSKELVELREKWRRDEVNLQWLFLVGCQALRCHDSDPFEDGASGSGTIASLCFGTLNMKGVCGFSEHGFTSMSFMRRMVKAAAHGSLADAWLNVWWDEKAKAYTWYETNEQFGRCRQKSFENLQAEIVPACMVRKDNAADSLQPREFGKPAGGAELLLIEAPDGVARRREGKLK